MPSYVLDARDKKEILKGFKEGTPISEIARCLQAGRGRKYTTVYNYFKKLEKIYKPKIEVLEPELYEIENILSITFRTRAGKSLLKNPIFKVSWKNYNEQSDLRIEDFKSQRLLIDFLIKEIFYLKNRPSTP